MASYTAKVNSIIVYGESSAMPVPSISFSSPNIVVDGHSSIVVIPQNLIFSSPNVEIISSHKQVIFNDLGIVALGPGTSITPGVWTIAKKGGASILVSPARLVFNDSNIQMSGHKTIVSNNTAILNLSGSNEIFAGSGTIIYPAPTVMNLSAFANIVLGTRITPTPPKLTFSTQDIILVGDVFTPPFMYMSLPGFEMGGESGGLIEAEIPEISLTGKLFPGKIASLNGNLPKLSMTATSGGYIDLNMPVIEQLDIQASTPIVAELDAKIQSPDLYISALHGGNNRASIVFPPLQFSCDIITGETANLSGSLLIPHFISTGFTGEVAEVTGNFPMLKSRMSGGMTGPGIISMGIEALKLSMESGSVDEGILRHVRGKIR